VLGDHLLDVILLLLVVAFGVTGYRQGFIVGALSFVGFFGGGVVGTLIAPPVARSAVNGGGPQQALLAIVIVFLAATIGQLLASTIGAALRSRVVWDSARAADAVGGAFVSAIALLLVAWLIGTAVARSPFEGLRTQVANSSVLRVVEGVIPDVAQGWFSAFRSLVDQTEFPAVFGGIGGESVVPVGVPDARILNTPELRKARRSIIKVVGDAPQCGRRVEGTGFVFAPQRVMTNAHVVAGVRRTTVYTQSGIPVRAQVVLYDPRRDVAVLYAPGLRLPVLDFKNEAKRGDNAVVAGFPKGRPFTAVAARVRDRLPASAPDIYHSGRVTREIFSIRGKVEHGNSGGPLLAPDGSVYGVIFAAAIGDEQTGYALTAKEVSSSAGTGRSAVRPVSTQACEG
jgi:S1-C subfamily serine protease